MNTKHVVQKVVANEKKRLKEVMLKNKYSPANPTKFLNVLGKRCEYDCVVVYDVNKTGNSDDYVTETYEVYEHSTRSDKLLVKQQLENYSYDLPVEPNKKALFCDVFKSFTADDKLHMKQELINCDYILSPSDYKTTTLYEMYQRLSKECKTECKMVLLQLLENYDYDYVLDDNENVTFYNKQKFEYVLLSKPTNLGENVELALTTAQKSQFLHKRLNKHYALVDDEYQFGKDCYFVVDAKFQKC